MLTAVREGIPFEIRMADGERYCVPDQYRVAVGKTSTIVVGEDDMPHILPLFTMTGITYLKDGGETGGHEQTSGGKA
jgi:hypothetical protein